MKLLCRLPRGDVREVTAQYTLYSLELEASLISIPLLTERGFQVVFDKDVCNIRHGKTRRC